jgi:hypothetical protein
MMRRNKLAASETRIIGVTGHRDIHPDAYESINEIAEAWFDEQILQHGAANLVVKSPLAAGADQLIARIALNKGIKVAVPHPFSLDRYRSDFSSIENAAFTSLLEESDLIYEVDDFPYIKNRYLAVGTHIAQTSHILLALWNGMKQPELEGGTAHIVRCQMEGFPENLLLPQRLKKRVTYWLTTPRASSEIRITPEIHQLSDEKYRILS